MRLCLTLPTTGEIADRGLEYVIEAGRLAEEHGVDALVVPEHVVMGSRADEYVWGELRGGPQRPFLDPLTTLGALVPATSRVRLATGIVIAPLRPAAVLAKAVATLDVLSGGRVELGVGAGWQSAEFVATGVPYARRGRLLTESIEVCRALWTDGPAAYDSEEISFDAVWCEPRPVQVGGPPVLFAGSLNARMVDRIVRLGNGWLPIMGSTIADVARGVARLRSELAVVGRDPESLIVRTRIPRELDAVGRPSISRTLSAVPEYREAGLTDVVVMLGAFVRSSDEVVPWLRELGARWGEVVG